ncbi:hypothetical protein X777_01898, partial [Ooceraea biroi]
LPDDVINTVTLDFDLNDKKLLEKCLGGFTRNNNESFNDLFWRSAPQTTWKWDCSGRNSCMHI